MLEVKFIKLYDDVKTPTKRDGDAGFDLYAHFPERYIVIDPFTTVMLSTGIKTAFDRNYVAILKERGSTGTKGIAQRSGVIDAFYRGEWQIPITNTNEWPLIITKDAPEITLDSYLWVKRKAILQEIVDDDKDFIDDYLNNIRNKIIIYPYEKAIAQVLFLPVPDTIWKEIDEFEFLALKTERGEGMLGSSEK